MRCTDCQRPIRPVVAWDIDGTLGNYHQHFLDFAAGWLGCHVDTDSYDGSQSLAQYLGITKELYRAIKLAYRQGGMKRTMPVYERAGPIVAGMYGQYEVWLTTTRPYLRLDNVDPDTREWLQRNGIPYDGLIYDEDKYGVLVDLVGRDRIIAVIDDQADDIIRAKSLGLHAIQIRRQHNMAFNVSLSPGAASLSVARNMVNARLVEWKQKIGA